MKIFSRVFIIFLLGGMSTAALAQPGDPGDPPRIPIDGGVTALLAAGALVGAKKIYDISKKKSQ
jgi:hypothetical protein